MDFITAKPFWQGLLFLLILASVTIVSYARLKYPQGRYRVLLTVLRGLVILLVVAAWLEPKLISAEKVIQKPDLVLLVDRSRSMTISDQEGRRIDLVKEKLRSSVMDDLAEKFELHKYSFGDTTTPLGEIDELRADAESTEIISSIESAINTWQTQSLAGVVVITDGIDTSGRMLPKEIHVPVYPVEVGSPVPPSDISVESIAFPPVAYTNQKTTIRVFIRNQGYDGQNIQVSLRETIDRQNETRKLVPLQGELAQVTFDIMPLSEGVISYEVELPNLPGEVSTENNRSLFSVNVVKSRLRVLVIETLSRWDLAFLRRTLDRIENIEPSYLLLSMKKPKDSVPGSKGIIPTENGLQGFPSLSEMLRYDAVIVGDLDSSSLSPEQYSTVVNYVSAGGGVFFLPGRLAMGPRGIGNTELARVIPIMIQPQGCIHRSEEFIPVLTQEGRVHPAVRLGETSVENEVAWQSLAPLDGFFTGFSLKPSAQVLARKSRDTSLSLDDSEPIIITQRYGSGKVILFAATGLWSWDFKVWSRLSGLPAEGNTPFFKFWSQSIKWLAARSGGKLVSVSIDKRLFDVGEIGRLNVRVYDETFAPAQKAVVSVILRTPYGKDLPLEVNEVEGAKGIYAATYQFLREGSYTFEVEAEYAGKKLGNDRLSCEVRRKTLEFERTHMNESLLIKLAEISGGSLVRLEEIEDLPEKIKSEKRFLTVQKERDIWDTPVLLILATAILAAEWILRKRKDLI